MSNICRICLKQESKPKKMKPLSEDILQRIEELSGIELKVHEEYPKMLCLRCMGMLEISTKFRAMCLNSESTLLSLIIKPELKTEPVDFYENSEDSGGENDGFFEDFIEGREVEDLSEIADFANEANELENPDDSMERVMSDSESILSIIEEEKRKRRIKKVGAKTKPTPTTATAQEKPKKTGVRGRKKADDSQSSNIMCEICGNIYKQRNLLNMHMRRHMEDKPFECEICSKSFACPSEIRRHMRTHTGEKPYVCRFCGRTFADRSTNIKHERIHTNERPFTCKTCGKSFTYSNVLKNHMLTHTGEKPFPCYPCNKTFSRKHQLDQHFATLTHQQTVKSLTAGATAPYVPDSGEIPGESVGDLLMQEII